MSSYVYIRLTPEQWQIAIVALRYFDSVLSSGPNAYRKKHTLAEKRAERVDQTIRVMLRSGALAGLAENPEGDI